MKQRGLNRDQKVLYFEVMRIFAAFFVVFNHSGNYGFARFCLYPDSSVLFWIYLAMAVFCKFAVPLFFMISGALMLHKTDEPLKKLWKEKILKYAIIIVVISLVYFLFYVWRGTLELDWFYFGKEMYTAQIHAFMWYLYAYIAFLISLPFLRALVKQLDDKYFPYLIVLSLITSGVFPILDYFLWGDAAKINSYFGSIWVTQAVVLYPCIGYYLEHRLDASKTGKWILPLWLVNAVLIGVTCVVTYFRGQDMGEYSGGLSEKYFSAFTLVNAMTLYITIRHMMLKVRVKPWLKKGITMLSGCTFGVYLIHFLILDLGYGRILFDVIVDMGINSMVAGLCMCLFVMAVSVLITMILKQIPVIRNYI